MTRIILSVTMITIVLTMVSCTPHIEYINATYSPIETLSSIELESPKKIRVQKFADTRQTDVLSGEKIVGSAYDLPILYKTKNDVIEVITSAAQMELRNKGYHIVEENEDCVFQGNLLSLVLKDQTPVTGFKPVYEGGIQLNVILKDVKRNEVVWTDTINGRSRVKRYATPEAVMEEALTLAMKDLMNNLVNDETLNAALKQ